MGTARTRTDSARSTQAVGTTQQLALTGVEVGADAAIGDPERTIADGLRTVWASLWAERAYEERELGNIEQTAVAMGVLIRILLAVLLGHLACRAPRWPRVGILPTVFVFTFTETTVDSWFRLFAVK